MSSFVNAAPFNNQESSNSLEQRRKTRNLTLKKPPPKKMSINSTLHAIHSNSMDDNSFMDNFVPPGPPASSVSNKLREGNHCNGNSDEKSENFVQEGFFSQDEQVSEYPGKYEEKPMSKMEQHKQFLNVIKNSVNTTPASISGQITCPEHYNSFSNEQKELVDKINYMIQLLETQKTEKTEGVLEDVVLYSFLGIFIIFLVESFTKVGKYVR